MVIALRHTLGIAAMALLALALTDGADARGRLAEGGVFQRTDLFGCTKPENFTGIMARGGADRRAADELRDRLVRSGACAIFMRGEPFSIEEVRGALVCLRPQSERDCWWSSRTSIAE